MLNFTVFIAGEKSYRLKRFKEEVKKLKINFNYINTNCFSFSDKSFISLKNKNIGYFIGDYYKNKYFMKYFNKKILFPQKKSSYLSDKFNAFIFFKINNIKTPKTSLLLSPKILNENVKNIGGFPCLIKKTEGSQGEFVEIVKNKKDIINFILKINKKDIISTFPKSYSFILQQPLKESYGIDYRALFLKDELLGIIKRTSQGESFKANVSLGGKAELVENVPEIEKMGRKIMKKSGLFIAGIDFIKGKDGYYAIEINTSPQFEGFEKATGINVAEKILKELIKL